MNLWLCSEQTYKIDLLHQIVVPQLSDGWLHNYLTKKSKQAVPLRSLYILYYTSMNVIYLEKQILWLVCLARLRLNSYRNYFRLTQPRFISLRNNCHYNTPNAVFSCFNRNWLFQSLQPSVNLGVHN